MGKNIAVVGTGYVGLVTGVALAEIGHFVKCIDIDESKVEFMNRAQSPIYEPGLEDMMESNIKKKRLEFTTSHKDGFLNADVIYIAVGTPENEDGSADLKYIEKAVNDIIQNTEASAIVVMKSTVPVGTNNKIQVLFNSSTPEKIFKVVSNPEFLREGSAVYDAFNGDRIVIGSSDAEAANLLEEINAPFNIQVFKTDILSAEMIKYASNAFLATKISFINEISNICEKIEANIDDVAYGMGLDNRIGSSFLNAGIGYGGSCFPKDTKALAKIAGNLEMDFNILKSVIEVNNKQQLKLIDNILTRFQTIKNMKIAILGLSFKPNTDDMREAASIEMIKKLMEFNVELKVYDPIAMKKAKSILPDTVKFSDSLEECI